MAFEVKKFQFEERQQAIKHFVQHGFAIYQGVHSPELVDRIADFVFSSFEKLKEQHRLGRIDRELNGWALGILKKYNLTQLNEDFISSPNMLTILKDFLGPDICFLTQVMFVNTPNGESPITKRPMHTDAWSGTSVNTLQVKNYFTDVDEYNSLSIVPGSHLWGFVPARNRKIEPSLGIEYEELNLSMIKKGDLLLFHPLLLHGTSGHSPVNTRVSLTCYYSSTETPFSSQERGLGYRTVSVGPMNQILRLVGNDHLSPLRVYGGFPGVDRRLRNLYTYSNYESHVDYSEYL